MWVEIKIGPPPHLYKEMIRSIFVTLEDLGYELEYVERMKLDIIPEPAKLKTWQRRGRKALHKSLRRQARVMRIKDPGQRMEALEKCRQEALIASKPYFDIETFRPGSVNAILEMPLNPKGVQSAPFWAIASFIGKGKSLGVDASFQHPGVIELNMGPEYFKSEDAFDDLKTLISRLPLTENTFIQGGGEEGRGTPWIFKGKIRYWMFRWIDEVPLSKWNVIVANFPELKKNVLASFPRKRIVVMGDSPFVPNSETVRVFKSKKKE
jgi:hypothetical protein